MNQLCYKRVALLGPKKGVFKQSLSGEQEKQSSQAGNKGQNFQQLAAIPSF